MPEQQLRIYSIKPGKMAAFVDGWRSHILPLRQEMGFEVSAWVNEADNEFVWLVTGRDGEPFDEQYERYIRERDNRIPTAQLPSRDVDRVIGVRMITPVEPPTPASNDSS